MSAKDLEELLGGVEDTRELVLRPIEEQDVDWLVDELHIAWVGAADEAQDAYDHWRERPGRDAYLVYRAAEDRADAALATLASESAI
jgi:hypothetical protein